MFKQRSRFGRFIDEQLGYGGQERIKEETGLTRETVSKACNKQEYTPKGGILKLLLQATKHLTGKNVKKDDFWA
ncbi:transcriptional regulator [Paenibacillus montanisoli]|uniref:Transcriptional regulator n=1 Tax=Paenibacillus montanisoli TaxID=2081970 RepID=A0A328U3C3_9BACL|nr:transcriptional regulator [Paenibacillus montanisoli]